MNIPKLITVKDLMVRNDIDIRETYHLFHTKSFPSIRIGKRLYVRENKLMEWEESQIN
jgi:hypothetical protein